MYPQTVDAKVPDTIDDQPNEDLTKEDLAKRELILRRVYKRLMFSACLAAGVCLILALSSCGDSSVQPTQAFQQAEVTENPTSVQPAGSQSAGEPVAEEPAETADNGEPTETSHTELEHSVRYTDSDQDIWPPQPLDMTNVEILLEVSKLPSVSRNANATQAIRTSPEISDMLGTRYEILASHEVSGKSDDATHIETEIFAYETNQVVTLILNASDNTLIRHTVADAASYQPPESQTEVNQAIELATHALSKQGFTEHLALKGTGLLAFPTAAETASTGQPFFSTRKIYVTFGEGNGKLPEYRALVDLSTLTVENSGAIQ